MVSRVLVFPSDPADPADTAAAPPSRKVSGRRVSAPSPAARKDAPPPTAAATLPPSGPKLIYSRASTPSARKGIQSQTRWIEHQVEQEVAQRVQRETGQRFGTRRTHAFNLPPQVMEIGLRQRLLDALLFFGRPA